MTTRETLLLEERGPVAHVTLNRPDRLNALNVQTLSELLEVVREFEARPVETRPRALVITGQGEKAFAAGADIQELSRLTPAEAQRVSGLGHELGFALERASFPSLSLVNGVALGGGLELALACDWIIASERARFGLVELNLGLVPGFGGSFRLAERVGITRARRLIYLGEVLSAAQALEAGLVEEVVPAAELSARGAALAQTLAERAPLALAAAKRCLWRAASAERAALADHEAARFAALFQSGDAREGLEAFLAKRAARFTGR